MNRLIVLIGCALVCLASVLHPAWALPGVPEAQPDPLAKMLQEGWKPVADGVLQRDLGAGKVETYAVGAAGFEWMLALQQRRLAFLEHENEVFPSAELGQLIDSQREQVERLRQDVWEARRQEAGAVACPAIVPTGCFCNALTGTITCPICRRPPCPLQ